MREGHLRHGQTRLFSAITYFIVVFLAYTLLVSPASASAANRNVEGKDVKVFVGSSMAILGNKPHIAMRERFLSKLAKEKPGDIFSAVIVLDAYYSAKDIEEFAKRENVLVKRIYLWTPGETGRAAFGVDNNDVNGAIMLRYERAKNLEGSEHYGLVEKDYIRIIDGEYGIFCIVAEAKASQLNKLRSVDMLEFIDVKYSEKGERLAAKRGVTVQYIELPYKPDEAL